MLSSHSTNDVRLFEWTFGGGWTLSMWFVVNANIGKAYVEYENQEDANKAISYMDGGQLDGQFVECMMAPPKRRSPSPSPPPTRRRSRNISPPPMPAYRRRGPPPAMLADVNRDPGLLCVVEEDIRTLAVDLPAIREVEAAATIVAVAAPHAAPHAAEAVAVVEVSLLLDVEGAAVSVNPRSEIEAEEDAD
ncbi:hypothetical protein DFQ29_007706 [Apophysomyces sp. BC1021]|nr:hypothetical protein DFQ29_007706 [Apophysomyces sp. BC1021]